MELDPAKIASRESQVVTACSGIEPSSEVKEAEDMLKGDPQNVELWLKRGHALARQAMFREAIASYSMGLTYHPRHALSLRFRGHRYLSIRCFQQGAADLEESSRIDPSNWDTWYHLGLAYYLLGDYARAEKAYETCLPMTPATNDPTLLPAITDWLWMTKMRLGKKDEAAKLLETVDPAFDAGENQFYQNRVLVYAGYAAPETLRKNKDGSGLNVLGISTQCYGLSNYYAALGEMEKSNEVIRLILEKGYWPAFGYLAAEVDARNRGLL